MFVPSSPTWPPTEAPLRPWLARLVRLVLWGLLVAGLVLGLAWATLHFWIVPRIAEFRPALESLARQSLGVPVRIGGVSAQSTGWVPSFELRDIELLDAHGRPGLRLPRVLVALSLRSAALGQLEQLVLDAPELEVQLTADGQWRMAGMTWGATPQGDSAAGDWLFSQREVVVRSGRVHWHGPGSTPGAQAPLTLQDVDLVIRNSARQHALRLDATPPALLGKRFVMMGQFKRSLLSVHAARLADWSGQGYALLPQVDLAQLQAQVPAQLIAEKIPVPTQTQGQGSLRLWADIVQGQWRGGVADVDLKGLRAQLTPKGPPLGFKQLSGRLGLQLHAEGFVAETHNLAFVSDQGLHGPGGHVSLEVTHAQASRPAKGLLKASQLDLQALQTLALGWPLDASLSQTLRPALQERSVSGRVLDLQMRWQGPWRQPETYEAQASVQGLSWYPKTATTQASKAATKSASPSTTWPGLRGMDLKLTVNPSGGHMALNAGAGSAVWLPGVLSPAMVPLQTLQASARWERQGASAPSAQRWHVPQWQLKLANADLQGAWQGQWQPAPNGQGPGVLALKGEITRAQVSAAHRYLPLSLPQSLRDYLREALVKGQYDKVQMQLNGDLAKLPFATPQEGTLRFSGQLKDAVFDMVPTTPRSANDAAWPRLQALKGQLTFDGLGMQLSDASARWGEGDAAVTLQASLVDMANMHDAPVLRVQAESQSNAAPWLRLVQQSPLDKLLSGALRHAQGEGPLKTRVDLRLPLLALQKTQVQGSVQFSDTRLRVLPGTPWLEKLQGTLQFHQTGFEVAALKAQLLGGPVRIDGGLRPSGTGNKPPALQFQAKGRVSAEGLQGAQAFYPLNLLTQNASGATDYSAELAWQQGQPTLSVRSRLAGLALPWPAPLGKTADSERNLSVHIQSRTSAQGPQDEIQVALGDEARLTYVRDLSGTEPQVVRGIMGLGVTPQQMPTLPDSGVIANMAIDRLDVNEWLALVPRANTQPNKLQQNAPPAWQSYLPTRIGLRVNTLVANDRRLHQVVAGGTREGAHWQANIDATELNGHVAFRQSFSGQPGQLFARLNRLNLPPSSATAVESLLEAPPDSLPALDIVVDALELRGKKWGRIEVEAINTRGNATPSSNAPAASEWQVKKFNITLPEGSFKSNGRWLAAREGVALRKTEMNFVLDTHNAGQLLARLGTPDALRGGTGQLEGVISWQGSPLTLHVPSMNGHFEVRMGQGQFLKADAGAAKLLGVLSLQALPRRLLLDFRDVFAQGFAFDSVQGDVTIVHGMANTRNLQIKGVNALVLLDGSADIAQENQKLRVQILPIVDTGTASLLAGLAVNPLVGLTTFLAQWLLQNPLARASAQEFLVDGSWQAPRVTRVEPRSSTTMRP